MLEAKKANVWSNKKCFFVFLNLIDFEKQSVKIESSLKKNWSQWFVTERNMSEWNVDFAWNSLL